MKSDFEEIPHSGGTITFSNGQTIYKNLSPFPVVLYEIFVSLTGKILGRRDFTNLDIPESSIIVMIASDSEGYFGYSCPKCRKYFRVAHANKNIICPYCIYLNDALSFLTDNQKQYIELYLNNCLRHFKTGEELHLQLDTIVEKLEHNRIELNTNEIRQQQMIDCKDCKIKFDILGVYASCPGCGDRNTLPHFINRVKSIKEKIENDTINCDQALSEIIEAFSGMGSDVNYILGIIVPLSTLTKKKKKVDFQKIIEADDALFKDYGFRFFQEDEETKNFVNLMFQKRHILVHNSGVVDEQYIKKTLDASVQLGQKISISCSELNTFSELIVQLANKFFSKLNVLILKYIKNNVDGLSRELHK